jgi:hypothetical protein
VCFSLIKERGGLITLFLFFVVSDASASWNIKIDEDSQGQRCILYKETQESEDNLVEETKRYAYFTIVSSFPLKTEFSFKFPSSASLVVEPKIKIAGKKFSLISRKGFGWLSNEKNEAKLLRYIGNEKSMLVVFTTDGRLREERVSLSGVTDALSRVSNECRFKT